MMRTIHLHGNLKREFGPSFRFDIDTAGEALRALNVAFPTTFVETIKEGSYQIIRGRRHGGMSIDLDFINTLKLGSADLHIVPVVRGAGSNGKGIAKSILGVALIGAAIFFSGGALATPIAGLAQATGLSITWGNIGLLGLGMTLAGVSSMLASQQKPKATESDQSFSFGGPVNANEQGNAVPLIYGEVITGSQPISAGFDIEDLNALKVANANTSIPAVASQPITDDPTP